jgi:hypothetical protein
MRERLMTKREKLTIEFTPALREALRRMAAEEGRTVSNLVRRLVAQGLDQHDHRGVAGGGEAGDDR